MENKNIYTDGFKLETQKHLNTALLSLLNQRDELTQQRDELTQQRDELANSTIWRLTKPLRDLINFFKK